MWRSVGIRRDAESLTQAQQQVEFWDRYVSAREFADPNGWELQNMLLVARTMIAAAIARTESRGVHFRNDFPETDTTQTDHISLVAGQS
jgi:L-aspartate oxidase